MPQYGFSAAWTIKIKFSFATSLIKIGKLTEALELYEELLDSYQRILGNENRNTQIVAALIAKIKEKVVFYSLLSLASAQRCQYAY